MRVGRPKKSSARRKATEVKHTPGITKSAPDREKPLSFWRACSQTIADYRLILTLALICIPAGISMQLSWLEFRCIGEPFLGSTKATCRDNLWRMIFGGPIVLLLAGLIIAWIKTASTQVSRVQLLLPFFLLLATCVLPFIHDEPLHDGIIQIIAVGFLSGLLYSARHKLSDKLRSLFVKPSFTLQVRRRDRVVIIVLSGLLQPAERDWTVTCLTQAMSSELLQGGELEIDVHNLQGFDQEYAYILQMLIAHAGYLEAPVKISGAAATLKSIKNALEKAQATVIFPKR